MCIQSFNVITVTELLPADLIDLPSDVQRIILAPHLSSRSGGSSTSLTSIRAACRSFEAHSFLAAHARTSLAVDSVTTAALLPYRSQLQSLTWTAVQAGLLWTVLGSSTCPMPQLVSLSFTINRNLDAPYPLCTQDARNNIAACEVAALAFAEPPDQLCTTWI